MSETKSYAGSIYHMSPEMINGENYGRHTDIWSLGCVVYEMYTGKSPFYKNIKNLNKYQNNLIFPNFIGKDAQSFI